MINSEHQPGERYFRKDMKVEPDCDMCEQMCCKHKNDLTIKSLSDLTECEYNYDPDLNSLPSIPECYKCPFPSIADVSAEQESGNNQLDGKDGLGNENGVKPEDPEASNLTKDIDSVEFKEFMKTVPLTGDAEIDNEIYNFYRNKFCS